MAISYLISPPPASLPYSCQEPNDMFAAEWQYSLVLAFVTILFLAMFIWRSKRIHVHVIHQAEVIKATPVLALLLGTYLAMIILVDVGVIDSWPWYTVASAVQCTLQTLGVVQL